jgi:hypothetical protein
MTIPNFEVLADWSNWISVRRPANIFMHHWTCECLRGAVAQIHEATLDPKLVVKVREPKVKRHQNDFASFIFWASSMVSDVMGGKSVSKPRRFGLH